MNIIGLDIGASSIKAGIISKEDGIFRKIQGEEKNVLETNEFSELKEKVVLLCKKKLEEGANAFVGISTAGSVDNSGVVVSAGNFKNYCNISWQELLEKELGSVTVATANDGRASAWGEYIVCSEKADTHVHTVVGTGIGGGVIHKGELLKGDSGQAGYIGHIKVTPEETPLCSCGKMGCVESLASAKGMLLMYNKKGIRTCETFEELLTKIDNDKEGVLKVLITGGYWLGVALGNVMNILNPQRITIGGGVVLATKQCVEHLGLAENPYLSGVKEGVHYATHRRVEATGNVDFGILGNDAGMIGAANLVARSAKII